MGWRDLKGKISKPPTSDTTPKPSDTKLDSLSAPQVQPSTSPSTSEPTTQAATDQPPPSYKNKNTFSPNSPQFAREGLGDGRLWEAQQAAKRAAAGGKLKTDDNEPSWFAKWQMSFNKFA